MPTASTVRSPLQSMRRATNGLITNRMSANAEITAPTSKLPTPKLSA